MPKKKETRGRKKVLTERQYQKNQMESQAKWHKEHSISIVFRLNKETDAEIIERIKSQPNQTDYIRKLVKADIEKGK